MESLGYGCIAIGLGIYGLIAIYGVVLALAKVAGYEVPTEDKE